MAQGGGTMSDSAEEIATKIIEEHWGHCEGPYDLIPQIAAALREYGMEACRSSEVMGRMSKLVADIASEKARTGALLEAQKIAEKHMLNCVGNGCNKISEEIRRLREGV
jgi:hypothetical protein